MACSMCALMGWLVMERMSVNALSDWVQSEHRWRGSARPLLESVDVCSMFIQVETDRDRGNLTSWTLGLTG